MVTVKRLTFPRKFIQISTGELGLGWFPEIFLAVPLIVIELRIGMIVEDAVAVTVYEGLTVSCLILQ